MPKPGRNRLTGRKRKRTGESARRGRKEAAACCDCGDVYWVPFTWDVFQRFIEEGGAPLLSDTCVSFNRKAGTCRRGCMPAGATVLCGIGCKDHRLDRTGGRAKGEAIFRARVSAVQALPAQSKYRFSHLFSRPQILRCIHVRFPPMTPGTDRWSLGRGHAELRTSVALGACTGNMRVSAG